MIVELRQYTLHPGRRDVLIDLFDREFVETQEAEGMTILGQFRDLDNPDRFVWLRSFEDMPSRAQALQRFYTGPAWKANSAAANATMIDVDNVLLLRPSTPGSGFPKPAAPRPPIGHSLSPGYRVLVTIHLHDQPVDDDFRRRVLAQAGITPLVCLQTEYAENNFPALPVRTGEHVFVVLAKFASEAELNEHLRRHEPQGVQTLRLAPTARSMPW